MAELKTTATQAGFDKLKAELEDLKVRQRKEISQKIKEAREQGDLSENAEYAAAKEEQSHIEGRIEELEALIKNVVVVDDTDDDTVNLGMRVRVKNETAGMEMTFNLVGTTEANSLSNCISDISPLGKALMGKKAGETARFNAPMGVMEYTILSIEKIED